eukprot:COSAG02_NODE_6393_length_3602_cov_8.466743_2_plen_353_part_00
MSSGGDSPSEGIPPEATTGSGEAEAAELERRAAKAQGEAAVAAFLDEAQLDSSLGPQLCVALDHHGSQPEEWVPTLMAMPADTFEELLEAVKEHPPSNSVPPDEAPALTKEEMVQRIFSELDLDKDGRLNFEECVSLAARTGGSMDRGAYETVAKMVGAAPSEGLTPAHLKDVYLRFKMGDVGKDWSQITGAGLPQSTDAQPSDSLSDPVAAGTHPWLLTEIERLRSIPFSWDNDEHTRLLGHVWSVGAPPAESITASERMVLPHRLELLISLPLFMGFGSRMAQVRLANALEEVVVKDGDNIITEGEPVNAASCMYCVVAGSPVAMSSDIGTLKVYQEGEWFGERGKKVNT